MSERPLRFYGQFVFGASLLPNHYFLRPYRKKHSTAMPAIKSA